MSQIMNYVEYLSKEIGPRPAGTEEEQQAALYITEQLQKEAGFTASIEDFASSSNVELGLAILAGVPVLVTVLSIFLPILSIPAFVLAAVAAAVYVLEAFDRPVLSRILARGASQNVIAKYQPSDESEDVVTPRGRRLSRKIVLVAHYDTGRVVPSIVTRVESIGLPLGLICSIAMVAAAFFLLIRIFVSSGGGMGLLVLNVLSIVAIIICLLPVAKAALVRSAPYNEGATNNATGAAALIEIARRIARGSVSEAELVESGEADALIHGEAAAREAGLIPEGAQIRYESEQLAPPSEIGDYDEEERLLSAKAAIAALTGVPVERRVFGSVANNLVSSHADEASASNEEMLEEVMAPVNEMGYGANGVSVTGAPAYDFSSVPGVTSAPAASSGYSGAGVGGFENAPSWFVAAQQNARKGEDYDADAVPQVKRSRYTEAMENAERWRVEQEAERQAAAQAEYEAIQRAREEEARAIAEKEANDPVEEPVPATTEQFEAPLETPPEQQPVEEIAQSPDSTIAMPAPIPSSEILAEVAAAESGDFGAGQPEFEPIPEFEPEPEPAPEPAPEPEPDQGPQSRIAELPSINPEEPYGLATEQSPSRSGILRKLRTSIPSLSGLIAPVPEESAKPDSVKRKPSVRSASPDGAVQKASSDNLTSSSSTGAVASRAAHGSEVVEVPRSRSGNLINRFKKNDDESLSDTPQQWLNVDDDFEARSVGRARGGWESFRDDQDGEKDIEPSNAGEEPQEGRRWQGGAFSRMSLGHVNMRSGEESQADEPIVSEPVEVGDLALSDAIEQIYHFRNPYFNTEIWFVGIGADGVSHDGARAFIEEHRDELRGSMIIEIESLGAGTLSVASEEGRIRKVTASSRVKRFTRAATAATGIALDSVSLFGTDSIASTMQKAGLKTMHLFGAEDGRPALKGSADDVLENVDEHVLDEQVSFVFELLKS